MPTILVVDDAEDNRDLYVSYFRFAGYEVEEARDGREALSMLPWLRPDLVVMDLSMPGLDGWETTRIIKSNPATENTIVLVLTGHATDEGLLRATEAGADAIRTKPCLPSDLAAYVRDLLDERD